MYQNTPRTVISLPGLTASAVELAMDTKEKFDLTLTIVEQAESHKAVLQYNIDLFDEATISRLLNHYQSCCKPS